MTVITITTILLLLLATVECIRPGRLLYEGDVEDDGSDFGGLEDSDSLGSRVEALLGSNLTLRCPFSLEAGEQLYSIKWHKKLEDGGGGGGTYAEFYSVIYSQPAPTIHHKTTVPGVRLLVEEENESWKTSGNQVNFEDATVTLLSVDLDTEGSYRCVATADGIFEAVRQQITVVVFIPPTSPPKMTTAHQRTYGIGDRVSLGCTSSPSRPKSQISWFINDIPVPEDYAKEVLDAPKEKEEKEEVVKSTTSLLEFTLQAEHIVHHHSPSSSFTVRCSSMMAARFLPTILNSREIQLDALHVHTPLISGLQEEYELGDWVDLNCTVPALLGSFQAEKETNGNNKIKRSSSRSISLEWHINGRKAHSSWLLHHFVPGLLGLRFQLEEGHLLQEGDAGKDSPPPLTIKCLSVQAWPLDPRMPAPANGTVKVRESLLEEDEQWPMARKGNRKKKKKKKGPHSSTRTYKRPVLVEVVRQSSTSTTTTTTAAAAAGKSNGTATTITTTTTAEETTVEDNSTTIFTTAITTTTITSISEEDSTALTSTAVEVGAIEDVFSTTAAAAVSTSADNDATTTVEPELSSTTVTTEVQLETSTDEPRVLLETLRQLGSDHKLLLLPMVLLGAIFALF